MNNDNISRIAASDHIKNRLIQTAMNNMEDITTYEKVCVDIAENRFDTWMNEVPAVKLERKPGKWIGETAWSLPYCSECGASCFGNHGFDAIKTPYCPTCGARMEDQT